MTTAPKTGTCACGNPMGKESTQCRDCFEVRSTNCQCGKRKDPESERCRDCYNASRALSLDLVCPGCQGPKSRRSATCRKCVKRTGSHARDGRFQPKELSKAGSGYVKALAPEHPRADKRGKVLQHILVMEAHIGRQLLPGEEVHHTNTVRDDNRIENLELWGTGQPKGGRAVELLAWARETIDRYSGIEELIVLAGGKSEQH